MILFCCLLLSLLLFFRPAGTGYFLLTVISTVLITSYTGGLALIGALLGVMYALLVVVVVHPEYTYSSKSLKFMAFGMSFFSNVMLLNLFTDISTVEEVWNILLLL